MRRIDFNRPLSATPAGDALRVADLLRQLGHKLGAEPAADPDPIARISTPSESVIGPPTPAPFTLIEQARVRLPQPAKQGAFMFGCGRSKQDAAQDRNQCQRQHKRSPQGVQDGQCHRLKQLSFNALQRQDRQVHDGDDGFAEHGCAADLHCRIAYDPTPLVRRQCRTAGKRLRPDGAPHFRR